jgi:integrase
VGAPFVDGPRQPVNASTVPAIRPREPKNGTRGPVNASVNPRARARRARSARASDALWPGRTEKRPFESWAQLDELAVRLGPRYGPPVLFAAATGLRPGEWMALEQRDIDRQARVGYVRRALRTVGSRARRPRGASARCRCRPSRRGGYFDLHNFRNRHWKPAQIAADIVPLRRVYDLREVPSCHSSRALVFRSGTGTPAPARPSAIGAPASIGSDGRAKNR